MCIKMFPVLFWVALSVKPQSLYHIFLNYAVFSFGQQLDEEPFNPDYVEVDRVLDMSTGVDQNSGEVRNRP